MQRLRHLQPSLQIVLINAVVFVGLHLAGGFGRLWGHDNVASAVVDWLALPSTIEGFVGRPWTLLSYMFVQYDVMHLLMNMLWFYMFASILQQSVSRRALWGVYLVGGLVGGVAYLCCSAIWPESLGHGLVGASASALAVMGCAMMRHQSVRVNLFFFGEASLKLVCLIALLLLIIATIDSNIGVHASHGAGFMAGIGIAVYLHSRWRRKRMATRHIHPSVVAMSASLPKIDCSLDDLLDKIRRSGYGSLTAAEREHLFKISSGLKNENENGRNR